MNLLTDQKKKIKKQYGHLKDILDLKLTIFVMLLKGSEKLHKEFTHPKSIKDAKDLFVNIVH